MSLRFDPVKRIGAAQADIEKRKVAFAALKDARARLNLETRNTDFATASIEELNRLTADFNWLATVNRRAEKSLIGRYDSTKKEWIDE